MIRTLTPECYAKARAQFQNHPVLKRVADTTPMEVLTSERTHFESLVRSIVFQQLSGKAASTIFGRFRSLFPEGEFPAPELILRQSVETLREQGISRPKAAYILDLAQHVADGRLGLDHLETRTDEEIRSELTQVKGFGVWSADMFLIFTLHRASVWPTLDLGVRNGYAKLAGLEPNLKPKELVAVGEEFAPYQTIAALYCWKCLEPDVTLSG